MSFKTIGYFCVYLDMVMLGGIVEFAMACKFVCEYVQVVDVKGF